MNVRIDPCNQSGETVMGRRGFMGADPANRGRGWSSCPSFAGNSLAFLSDVILNVASTYRTIAELARMQLPVNRFARHQAFGRHRADRTCEYRRGPFWGK